ncbi:hypothetical protein [Legionella waltersii]|uniref:RNA binding protein (Contains ribosomal protein S1 domain) n=1 Tax=Legionella waltersii TaxID=66969 RepID=A0A0W1A731_9GAMM|nr:hypothetical protein [Legionella waltersii]KTD77149.1 RNA binding protein (contains ribosomal protein S1 domain) [Legionella waltersii]SNV11456.1 RNA binding protein (contains ribosomal protein S1 domain) [Legionella waltersii]
MIILYVPFSRDKSGDLSSLVELWKKNHLQNRDEPLFIMYFEDEVNFDVITEKLEIYICAHGASKDENFMLLGNKADFSNADFIDMSTLADRFNHDLAYVSAQISAIHLYCCGSQKKNEQMSIFFQHGMILYDGPIKFYGGNLTPADNNGRLWSIGLSDPKPVWATMQIIRQSNNPVDESLMPERSAIKRFGISHEEALAKHRARFFEKIKKKRASDFREFRQGKENIDNSGPVAKND